MKKIQIITYEIDDFPNLKNSIDINTFNSPNSLDNYDINFIDLSNDDMWVINNSTQASKNITLHNDFLSIKTMIENSTKSKIIVCLPQNATLNCNHYRDKRTYEIKNILPTFISIMKDLLPINDLKIFYENNKTKVFDNWYNSSFGFNDDENYSNITSSSSDKITTIRKDNLIITSLKFIDDNNIDLINNYLRMIGLIEEKSEIPEWVRKYNFYDDQKQNASVEKSKENIKKEKDKIEKANKVLENNLRYKSILYTNSDELVEVVFDILQDLFDITLKDFVDEKREDFKFKKNNITYIGEIKGVTSNVKNEHISQLDEHYSKYLDELQEKGITEDIRKILIMNYERNRDVIERNEIHIMQIDMAKKRDTLIIDTKTLLNIYELYLNKTITREKIIDYINNTLGIVSLEDIKNKEN